MEGQKCPSICPMPIFTFVGGSKDGPHEGTVQFPNLEELAGVMVLKFNLAGDPEKEEVYRYAGNKRFEFEGIRDRERPEPAADEPIEP